MMKYHSSKGSVGRGKERGTFDNGRGVRQLVDRGECENERQADREEGRRDSHDLSIEEIYRLWPFINVPIDGGELNMSH